MHIENGRMRRIVYLANFLLAFGGTITLFTNSSFIERTIGIQYVSLVYTFAAIVTIAILTRSTHTLERIGNRTFFLRYGVLYMLSFAGILLSTNHVFRVVSLGLYLCITAVLIFSINVFFAHLSPMRERGSTRAWFLLLGNLGVMFGPFCAARAIDFAGYRGTYILNLIVFLVLSILLYLGLQKFHDANYTQPKILSALHHTLHIPTLRNVIAANFILQFFFAWMVVYTPIYLSQYLGFSWDSIGIIFSCMLVAYIILDYPLGRLAELIGSEKELAVIGFLIMAACVFVLGLGLVTSVIGIGILLFISRVGAATVEAMTEIHFFKLASERDPSMLSLFCDIRPLSYVIAPLLGAVAIVFLPFHMIFIILGIILLGGCHVALSMEKTKTWWARAHK